MWGLLPGVAMKACLVIRMACVHVCALGSGAARGRKGAPGRDVYGRQVEVPCLHCWGLAGPDFLMAKEPQLGLKLSQSSASLRNVLHASFAELQQEGVAP